MIQHNDSRGIDQQLEMMESLGRGFLRKAILKHACGLLNMRHDLGSRCKSGAFKTQINW